MDDLTKFIKPLSKQTSWADAVDDDSSDEDFDVGDSRDGFEENQNSNDCADVDLQQKSSKVVQGVSFASLLRSTSGKENAPSVAEKNPPRMLVKRNLPKLQRNPCLPVNLWCLYQRLLQ